MGPQKEVYFLTIDCQPSDVCHLTKPGVAEAILRTVAFRQEKGFWFAHLFLLMPDHVHALLSFPPSNRTLKGVISQDFHQIYACLTMPTRLLKTALMRRALPKYLAISWATSDQARQMQLTNCGTDSYLQPETGCLQKERAS